MGDRRKSWTCAILALALLACVLGAMSCRDRDLSGTESRGRPMRMAEQAEAAENWGEAIRWYETALRHRPQMALAHRRLAAIFQERMQNTPENLAAAIHHYHLFLKLAPETEDAEIVQEQIERCIQYLSASAAGDDTLTSQIDELRDQVTDAGRDLTAANAEIRRLNEQLAAAQTAAGRQVPPPPAAPPALRNPPKPPPGGARAGGAVPGIRTYVVKSGDTFTSIAKKHGTTVDAISRLNPNVEPTRLKPGATLNLPP